MPIDPTGRISLHVRGRMIDRSTEGTFSMSPVRSGLRIGVLNTHLDSLIFEIVKDWDNFLMNPSKVEALHAAKIATGAEQIADRILHSGYDYDIVVLIEVFSEDARSILLSKLSSKYPYRIEKLPKIVTPLHADIIGAVGEFFGDALGTVLDVLGIDLPDLIEDSGLMLFSRYPIDRTDFKVFSFPTPEAFIEALPDSVASKGAAYARIINPVTREIYNLVLTHLQANEEKWAGVRAMELAQVKELIKGVMTDEMIRTEDLFIVGDLNLKGNWEELGKSPKDINHLKRKAGDEWEQHFRNPSSFFTTSVHDTWFYETSTKDRGETSSGLERIDYILHNPDGFPRLLVPQHLTKAYNLFSADGKSPSDHFGLNADLNGYVPHCSPRDSRNLTAKDGEYIHGAITLPGGMAWYRLDEPGTYSIAIRSDNGLEFAVYQSNNLSLPIGQYKGETTEFMDESERKIVAKKHVLIDQPFYVRVYHPDRTITGGYTLFVHKHAGLSKDDAIELYPHKSYPSLLDAEKPDSIPAVFPNGKAINSDDTIWFSFNAMRADSGEPQDIVCEVAGYVSGYSRGAFRMHLVKADGKSIIDSIGPDPSKLTLALSDIEARIGPKKVYLLVTRDDPTYSADTLTVKWSTNLTVFHGWQVGDGDRHELKIICEDETNPEPFGSDEIFIRIWVDGNKVVHSFVGEFEGGDNDSLEHLIPKIGYRYLHSITIQLYEKDHVSPDDPSAEPEEGILKEYGTKRKEKKFFFEDGEYTIRYNLSSQLTDI